jgi:hypothetical protein
VVPGVGETEAGGVAAQSGVERVRHDVEVGRRETGRLEAPGRRQLGQFPRRERDRPLAVLAPAESFFLRRRDHMAVNDQRCRRIMEDRIDTQNTHGDADTPVVAHLLE